jgi:hypothetical protein
LYIIFLYQNKSGNPDASASSYLEGDGSDAEMRCRDAETGAREFRVASFENGDGFVLQKTLLSSRLRACVCTEDVKTSTRFFQLDRHVYLHTYKRDRQDDSGNWIGNFAKISRQDFQGIYVPRYRNILLGPTFKNELLSV